MARVDPGEATLGVGAVPGQPGGEAAPAAAGPVVVLDAADGPALTVPGGDFLYDADYQRSGPDLVLTGPDGVTVVIRNYFSVADPPDLYTETGGMIPPDLAVRLAGPIAPGQYAQAGQIAQAAPIGRIETIQGDVVAIHTDGTRVTLSHGDSVLAGDIIETAAGANVGIVFVDKTTMAVAENARMVLDELIYNPATHEGSSLFSLLKGVFIFVTGEIGKLAPENVVVRTPSATLQVRGTKVAFLIQQDGQSQFTLFEGQASVFNNSNVVRFLTDIGSTTTVVSVDAAPSAVSVLSAADRATVFSGADAVSTFLNQFSVSPSGTQQQQNTPDGPSNDQGGELPVEVDPTTAIQEAGFTEGEDADSIVVSFDDEAPVATESVFLVALYQTDESTGEEKLIGFTITDGTVSAAPTEGGTTKFEIEDTKNDPIDDQEPDPNIPKDLNVNFSLGNVAVTGGLSLEDKLTISVPDDSNALAITSVAVGGVGGFVAITKPDGTKVTVKLVETIQLTLGAGDDVIGIGNLGDTDISDATLIIRGGPGNDMLTPSGDEVGKTLALFGEEGNDELTGGDRNDTVDGGPGNDTLRGGPGDDRLIGGPGNDTYIVDDAGDNVEEAEGEGVDTVESAIDYQLGDFVENLTLTGGVAVNATGNAGDNEIAGNDIANVIDGGLGDDVLTGNGGGDVFRFGENFGDDTITDFTPGEDMIDLGRFGPGLVGIAAVDDTVVISVGDDTITLAGVSTDDFDADRDVIYNPPPTVDLGGGVPYEEGQPDPVPAFANTDIDDDGEEIASATIKLEEFSAGDALGFADGVDPGLDVGVSDGEITLMGDAPIGVYEEALGRITFRSTSEDPEGTREVKISVTLTDTVQSTSEPAEATVTVTGVDDIPTVALGVMEYTEDQDAIPIAVVDIGDVDDLIVSATVTLGPFSDGDRLVVLDGLSEDLVATILDDAHTVKLVPKDGEALAPGVYQSALAFIAFESTSQDPDPAATRSVTVEVVDEAEGKGSATADIAFIPVNDPPMVDLDSLNRRVSGTGAAGEYVEGDDPVAITALARIVDPDNGINSVTVRIVNPTPGGKLSLSPAALIPDALDASIDVEINPEGTVVTFTNSGSAEPEAMAAALDLVVYAAEGDDPVAGLNQIEVTVEDEDGATANALSTIFVGSTNDAPTVSVQIESGFEGAPYVEGADPISLPDEVVVAVTDPDSRIAAARIRILNPETGDKLAVDLDALPVAIELDAEASTDTLLVFKGSALPADIEAAIRLVTFESDPVAPVGGDRVLAISVTDTAGATSASASLIVPVVPVNTPADLDLDPGGADSPDSHATFTEGTDGVLVAANATLSDPDSLITSSTATILNVLDPGVERLGGDDISAEFALGGKIFVDEGGTEINLSGDATAAEYLAVLKHLVYENDSEDPNATEVREIEIEFTDADGATTAANAFVTVQPVDDAPVLDLNGPNATGLGTTRFVDETTGPVALVADGVELSDVDTDAKLLTVTVTLTNAVDDPGDFSVERLELADGLEPPESILVTVAVTGELIFTVEAGFEDDVTVADFHDALKLVRYVYDSVNPPTGGTREIAFVASDESGAGETAVAYVDTTSNFGPTGNVSPAPMIIPDPPGDIDLTGDGLTVGFNDDGGENSFTIDGGRTLTSDGGIIGQLFNTTGPGQVTITSPGSTWLINPGAQLVVAAEHSGSIFLENEATLDVGGGASFTTIGAADTFTGHVELTDRSRLITNDSALGTVSGAHATVDILSGSTWQARTPEIGRAAGSDATVTVSGPESLFETETYITIGVAGVGVLDISDGGRAVTRFVEIASVSESDGTLSVDGAESSVETEDLNIGIQGQGTATFDNGARLLATGTWSTIGSARGGSGTMTLMNGARASFYEALAVAVASFGVAPEFAHADVTGTLDILSGSTVDADRVEIGEDFDGNGGTDGTVTVSGEDSALVAWSDLVVAGNGHASLTISDGGAVLGGEFDFSVGTSLGGDGHLVVQDPGSRLVVPGFATVGDSGQGHFELLAGATAFFAQPLYIGYADGSEGSVLVDGDGAAAGVATTLEVAGAIYVGAAFGFGVQHAGTTGELTIQNGGTVHSGAAYLGYFERNTFGTVTVTGENSVTGETSLWEIDGPLYVGFYGSGDMTISDGGFVQSDGIVSIADQQGSRGHLIVNGPESLLQIFGQTGAPLLVGRRDFGQVDVTGGGKITMLVTDVTIPPEGQLGGLPAFLVGGSSAGVGGRGFVQVVGEDGVGNPSQISLLGVNGLVQVGRQGSGILNLIDGGRVDGALSTIIGRADTTDPIGNIGRLSVSGTAADGETGSLYHGGGVGEIGTNSEAQGGNIQVGRDGDSFGILVATNGGDVVLDQLGATGARGLRLGASATDAGRVTASGDGSTVTVNGHYPGAQISVGVGGFGRLVAVSGGNIILNTDAETIGEGFQQVSIGNLTNNPVLNGIGGALIRGEGSLLQTNHPQAYINLGFDYGVASLTVDQDARLESFSISAGNGTGSAARVSFNEGGQVALSGTRFNGVGAGLFGLEGASNILIAPDATADPAFGPTVVTIDGGPDATRTGGVRLGGGSDPHGAATMLLSGDSTVTVYGANIVSQIGDNGVGSLHITAGGQLRQPVAASEDPDFADSIDGRAVMLVSDSVYGVGLVHVDGTDSLLDAGHALNASRPSGNLGAVLVTNQGLVTAEQVRVFQGGYLGGNSSVEAPVEVIGGEVGPGTSIGTLTVDSLEMRAGVFDIEVGDDGAIDLIHVLGDASIESAVINLHFVDGYAPAAGEKLTFLSADGVLSVPPENIVITFHGLEDFADGAAPFSVVADEAAGTLSVVANQVGTPVATTADPTNDAPTFNLPVGELATNEDTALAVGALFDGDVIGDANPEDIVEVTVSAQFGTLHVGDPGAATSRMSFTGTTGEINTALQSLVYVPNENYGFISQEEGDNSGLDRLVFGAADDGHAGLTFPEFASGFIDVRVSPVADTPTLTVADAVGEEDTIIPIDIEAMLQDLDFSEVLSVTVSLAGLPDLVESWTGEEVPVEGGDPVEGVFPLSDLPRLWFLPPEHYSGVFTATFTATATEIGTGATASVSRDLVVTVDPVGDAPVIAGNRSALGISGSEIQLGVTFTVPDPDEAITEIQITGVPDAWVLSAGDFADADPGDGFREWTLTDAVTPAELADLSVNPGLGGGTARAVLDIGVTTSEGGFSSSDIEVGVDLVPNVATDGTNDIDVVADPDGMTFTTTGFSVIGNGDAASMAIDSGAKLNSVDELDGGGGVISSGFVIGSGGLPEQDRSVQIRDAGSTWTIDDYFVVADENMGSLHILRDASVAVGSNMQIGAKGGSTGYVTVETGGTLTVADSLDVGYGQADEFGGVPGETAMGTLHLMDGGKAEIGGSLYTGVETNGEGYVTVEGAGSKLTAADYVIVGNDGIGEFNLLDGGSAMLFTLALGGLTNASGSVSVDGIGTRLEVQTRNLDIGSVGHGEFAVTGGATAEFLADQTDGDTDYLFIGNALGSSGQLVVNGEGSRLISNAQTVVANNGYQEEEDGPEYGVFGQATQGEITVSNGGYFWTEGLTFGQGVRSTGSLTVTGEGSELAVAAGKFVSVGQDGVGHVDINSGGVATMHRLDLGQGGQAYGSITVDGAGSQLRVMPYGTFGTEEGPNALLIIGDFGEGHAEVTNGGAILMDSRGAARPVLLLGNQDGGLGTLDIEGPGSLVDVDAGNVGDGISIVGDARSDAVVTVSDGAKFNVGRTLAIGEGSASGHVTVRGVHEAEDGTLTASTINATSNGGEGNVAIIIVGAGNTNGSAALSHGTLDVLEGATVNIEGNADGAVLNVGGNEGGPSPRPGGQGTVTVRGAHEAEDGTLTASTINFSSDATSSMGIGRYEGLGQVYVSDGGEITGLQTVSLGRTRLSHGVLRIDGDGSAVELTGKFGLDATNPLSGPLLFIGRQGSGAVEVLDGGRLTIDGNDGPRPGIIIGGTNNEIGGQGSLRISDATVEIKGVPDDPGAYGTAGFVSVGSNGNGKLIVENGGTLEGMRSLSFGANSAAAGVGVVTGEGSEIILRGVGAAGTDIAEGNAGGLLVGLEGSGNLSVLDGGKITVEAPEVAYRISPGFVIGGTNNSSGGVGVAEVSGPGSQIAVNGERAGVIVGRQGTGNLNINQGGHVVVNEETDDEGRVGIGISTDSVGGVIVDGTDSLLDGDSLITLGLQRDLSNGGFGSLIVANEGVARADEVLVGPGGRIGGNSTIDGDVTLIGGTAAPGLSAGTLTVTGDFTLDGGVLDIEIGGDDPGLYDVIDVDGDAFLVGGAVHFSFFQGFVPGVGDDPIPFFTAGPDSALSIDNIAFSYSGPVNDYAFDVQIVEDSLVLVSTKDGNRFNDIFDGTLGNNTINGGAGDDVIDGSRGDDVLLGGTGNDTLTGGEGDDRLEGGPGSDTAVYSSATASVEVDLGGFLASDGEGGTDTLLDVENVIGSPNDDTLIGDAADNALTGGGGDDILVGGPGADTLDGGAGNDTLLYRSLDELADQDGPGDVIVGFQAGDKIAFEASGFAGLEPDTEIDGDSFVTQDGPYEPDGEPAGAVFVYDQSGATLYYDDAAPGYQIVATFDGGVAPTAGSVTVTNGALDGAG